jgi:hypothetical protein
MTAVIIQDVITQRMQMWEEKLKKAHDNKDVIRLAARLGELEWIMEELEK